MAVYKVIQDVESEDKLLGPLTLKGFVYAAIAFISAFIEFKLIFLGTPLKWIFVFAFAWPMILFGVLASPLGREQPTEVWLLSRIRFFLKPRRRIWDEEGKNDLVTITVPQKIEKQLTKDLSPNEVKSRLKTLALTLDTRGWAVKNVDVNLGALEPNANIVAPQSDRLVKDGSMPHQMPVVDVHAADDILDEKNNPTAQKFESMMQKAEVERRHGLISKLKELVDDDEPPKRKLKSTKDLPATQAALLRAKKLQDEALAQSHSEKKDDLSHKLAAARAAFAKEHGVTKKAQAKHKVMDTKLPPEPPAPAPSAHPPASPVTPVNQAVNMELAQSGSAFSVATLSQLANRQPQVEQTGPNEVTISLH